MPELSNVGRILILIGLSIVGIGVLVWIGGRMGISLGRLPGDIRIQRGNFTCLIPIVSSLLVSLILTLAINLVFRWLNK